MPHSRCGRFGEQNLPAGSRNSDLPGRRIVTIPTELSRLKQLYCFPRWSDASHLAGVRVGLPQVLCLSCFFETRPVISGM